MNIRTITVAAFAAVSLAACNKPADAPASTDTTAPANATPTLSPTDSALKVDSTALKPTTDSAKPIADTAKPMNDGNPAH